MKVVYKPKGKAGEYSPLALNLYNGCSNGCKYCYVPRYCKIEREKFKSKIVVRKDVLKNLELDCIELRDNKDPILMCFTSDPYQKIEEELLITRQAIQILNRYNQSFQVLTKSGSLAIRDFELYKDSDSYAVTLTFDNEEDSRKYEPNADTPAARIRSLEIAKERGLKTWVSLEPVIYPKQSLHLIDLSYQFVDLFKVGKLNGNKKIEDRIDWRKFVMEAIRKIQNYKRAYYIKKDLYIYLP